MSEQSPVCNCMQHIFHSPIHLGGGALLLNHFVAFMKELAFLCEEWLSGK